MAEHSSDEEPLVSVVIPTYNSEKTIGRALASVFAQTYTPVEIIIADDCSTDNTVTAIENLQNSTIQIVRMESNGGPAKARNAGIDAAKGEYIAFLDSDDEWLPEKLAKQVEMLESNASLSIVGCRAETVDGAGSVLEVFPEDAPILGPDGWKGLLLSSWLSTICVMTRRDLLQDERFDETMQVAEDRDLWIRLARRGDVVCIQTWSRWLSAW